MFKKQAYKSFLTIGYLVFLVAGVWYFRLKKYDEDPKQIGRNISNVGKSKRTFIPKK